MSKNWNISGLILEGISGTGKTAIFKELVQTAAFIEKSYLTSINLSEHQTQRILEKKNREQGLTIEDNISLLESHLNYLALMYQRLEQMDWCNKNLVDMRIPFIFERFHLTHVYQYEHIDWQHVEHIDNRLAELNGHLCLLVSNRVQLTKRLFQKPDPSWQNYLKRFGDTENEIVDHFVRQQETLQAIAEKSKLQTHTVDTSEKSEKEIVAEILDFWDLA